MSNKGSGITLTNNEIKDIKLFKSLENRGILSKGANMKITSWEGGFLNFLRQLMSGGLPLMKKILTPLAKNDLVTLGVTAAISATDWAIQKNILKWGMTALLISNEEMEDKLKIVKSLKESDLLKQVISKQLTIKQKNKKVHFSQCYLVH